MKKPLTPPVPTKVKPRKPTVKKPSPKPSGATVYITKTGKKYHWAGCRHLRRNRIPISLKDAKAKGYAPCSECIPPA